MADKAKKKTLSEQYNELLNKTNRTEDENTDLQVLKFRLEIEKTLKAKAERKKAEKELEKQSAKFFEFYGKEMARKISSETARIALQNGILNGVDISAYKDVVKALWKV